MPRSTTLKNIFVSIPIILLVLLIASPAAAQDGEPQNVIVVISSADSGPGTLREAITIANRKGGGVINFDPDAFPADNPTTIWVESSLPPLLTGNITIDAIGAGVILDGSRIEEQRSEGATSGILIQSNDNTILGLQILNFPGNGIKSQGGERNTIGGARPAGTQSCIYPCNLLSGNGGSGVALDWGHQNIVQGNFIGTDISGTQAHGNDLDAIRIINSEGNLIGGYEEGEGNLMCDSPFGFEILESNANNNQVIGNHVGVDITGTKTIGNGIYGGGSVNFGNTGNVIENNIISGNATGFEFGIDTHDNILRNNYIGTNPDLSPDLGNDGSGVIITGGFNNTIGPGNVIMFNNPSGLFIDGENTSGNRLTQNQIEFNVITNMIISYNTTVPEAPHNLTISGKEIMGFADTEIDIEIYTGSKPGGGRYIGTANTGKDGIFSWKVPGGTELDAYVTALAYAEDGTTSIFAESVEVIEEPGIELAELPGTLDPSQISTKPEVLATNAVFAAGFLVYLGVVVVLFDKTLEEYGDVLTEKLLTPIKNFFAKLLPHKRANGNFLKKLGSNIWINWIVLLLIVASIQTLLDIELSTLSDWASLGLTIFISTLIVSGIQIANEQIIRRQIEQPANKALTNVRWAGVALATITMLFSRFIKFQPGFVLGAVDPFHYEPEIEDTRQEGALIFATKFSVFVITLMGWLLAGRIAEFSPGLRNLLVMAFTLALEAFFVELLPISKVLDGRVLLKWNFFAWLGLYLPVTWFAFWLLFNPMGEGACAVQQNSMVALISVMAFILVALLLLTFWGRWMEKKKQTA